MDIESLRCFVEVVRQQNVTRAAAHLNLAQPAVSRRIHLMEETLGTPLLMRHRRGVRPTEAGAIVFERAELILRLAEEAQAEVRSRAAEPTGQVRFGFPPSLGNVFVVNLVSNFLRQFPRVNFQLHEHFSPTVREALVSGRIDIGIMSCDAEHPDLHLIPLFQERLWVIGRSIDWPFGRVATLAPQRLAGTPLLVASFLRQSLDKLAGERQLSLNVRLEADALTSLRESVRMGTGYLIGPPSSVKRELENGEFAGAPIRGLRVTRGLFWRRDRPVTRALDELSNNIQRDVTALLKQSPKMFQPISPS